MNDSITEPTEEGDRIARRRLIIERALMLSLSASILLHSIGVVVAYSVKAPELSVEIDVRESAGVALMARIGWAEEEPETAEENEFVEVEESADEEPPDETEEPSTEDPVEEPPTEEPVEEPPTEEPVEEPSSEAPTEEPTAEEGDSIPVNANTPRDTEEPTEPDSQTNEERRPPVEEPPQPPVDPSELPPGQRYPEGTVNPVATDVGMWGPEGAASVAVVRNDRIRRSPHRESIEAIFGSLGDTEHLTANTGIDLIEDVDTMLLASTDVSDARRTFVAAVHHLDPAYLMSELRRGFPSGVRWERRSDGRYLGTPGASTTFQRRFLIPVDRLLVYSQPDLLDDLLRGAPQPHGLRGIDDGIEEVLEPPPTVDELLVALGLPEERPEEYIHNEDCSERAGVGRRRCRERREERRSARNAEIEAYDAQREELLPEAEEQASAAREAFRAARGNGRRNRADDEPPIRDDAPWIRGLLESGDLAGSGRSGPAVLWTFNGFTSFSVEGMARGTPSPSSLVAALSLERQPRFEGRFIFESSDDAVAFSREWDGVVEHYTFALMAAGLHRAFQAAEWEIDHNEAVVRIEVPPSALGRIASVLSLQG